MPQLGDGRANLLGEVLGRDGVRYDIQLKGSGPTPFSRGGDGRAALGPVLREYIVSEAMAALGVPTTRALAAVTTGERVLRETVLPGAVFTRVAASHLRVGTFQYFAAQGDTEGTRTLADYAIARHYPEAAQAKQPYRALLDGVIARQARLVAQWMLLGFIHGVMNTDNTSISGETIDYGPCAFMEAYDPAKVFSSIDHYGRYAYGNQPRAALWNLTRLAEALLPVLEQEAGNEEAALASANEALAAFGPQFEAAHAAGLRRKLGLFTEREGDAALAQDLLDAHGREPGRLHPDLPPAVRCRGRTGRRRGRTRVIRRPRRLRRVGCWMAPAPRRRARLGTGRALRPCGWQVRHSSRATTWWRRRSMPPSSGRTSSPSRNCWTSCHAPTRTGLAWSATPRRPAPRNACFRLSAVLKRTQTDGTGLAPLIRPATVTYAEASVRPRSVPPRSRRCLRCAGGSGRCCRPDSQGETLVVEPA